MIIIKNLKVEKPFMYIWLKNVHNVKLNYHCAKCLIGNYHPKINKKTKSIKDLVLDNDIWYLCGVSLPYNWNNNFHLAFLSVIPDIKATVFENKFKQSIILFSAFKLSVEFKTLSHITFNSNSFVSFIF